MTGLAVEFLTCAVFLFAGTGFLNAAGFRGKACALPGFLAGVMMAVGFGFLLVVSGMPTSPLWMLGACAGAGLVLWGGRPQMRARDALICLVLLGLGVFYFREANLVAYHIDSFRYILPSVLLAENTYDMASLNLLTKRVLSVPVLHASSRLAGEYYMRSVTPLVSVGLLGAMCWFFAQGTRQAEKAARYAGGAVMVLLLVSNNRYVFNSFYINGHLFFAACFTVIAACGWLAGEKEDQRFAWLMALAIPPLIVTRAEGVLFAVLAMGPFLMCTKAGRGMRALVAASFGVSAVLWFGYVVLAYADKGKDIALSAAGPLGLGAAGLVLVPVLMWQGLGRYRRMILFTGEVFLWAALAGLALVKPDILVVSLEATWENVAKGAGSWGCSLMILAGLVVFALVFCRNKGLDYLRFPLTASVPLFFLLAYFRDGAYRVGNGDSLNRMLIQVVPLAVMFLAVCATEARRVK